MCLAPAQGVATAIEMTAGGALYNVIVDTDQTGKLLLQKGKLRNRATIIPLNKIDARGVISEEKIRAAQKLVGKENACTALSLVGYDSELESAMSYVFGRSFVCTDAKSANAVTSNRARRSPPSPLPL